MTDDTQHLIETITIQLGADRIVIDKIGRIETFGALARTGSPKHSPSPRRSSTRLPKVGGPHEPAR